MHAKKLRFVGTETVLYPDVDEDYGLEADPDYGYHRRYMKKDLAEELINLGILEEAPEMVTIEIDVETAGYFAEREWVAPDLIKIRNAILAARPDLGENNDD